LLSAPDGRASPELDRKYSLERVGFLRAWDNVDGLFADYVRQAYTDFFAHQSRFVLQDLSKSDEILSKSKIPYSKVIEDPAILSQLARTLRSETIIRTRIRKEGPQYRFNLDWLHAPAMDVLATDTFALTEMQDVKASLQQALERLIAKVPLKGQVTGRDNNSVTVNMGTLSGIHRGDTLVIATLEEVKKHPLLHEIVDWRFATTGKVEVDQVDEAITFGRVTEEEEGHQIGRYQKVTQIIPRAAPTGPPILDDKDKVNPDEPPRLGWVAGGVDFGSYSRQYSALNNTTGKTGGGFLLGAQADGQVWLNREWFAEFGLGYAFWPYSQQDLKTNADSELSGATGGGLSYKADFGYTYLVSGEFFGPRGWIKVGYMSVSYDLAQDSDNLISPTVFRSVFLGIGGDLPIRDRFGALLNLDFGLFTFGKETTTPAGALSGDFNSASGIQFFAGGYYRLNNRMTIRAGIGLTSHSVEFSKGASLSQKMITFAPALIYYF
jgi:hypothetical protein